MQAPLVIPGPAPQLLGQGRPTGCGLRSSAASRNSLVLGQGKLAAGSSPRCRAVHGAPPRSGPVSSAATAGAGPGRPLDSALARAPPGRARARGPRRACRSAAAWAAARRARRRPRWRSMRCSARRWPRPRSCRPGWRARPRSAASTPTTSRPRCSAASSWSGAARRASLPRPLPMRTARSARIGDGRAAPPAAPCASYAVHRVLGSGLSEGACACMRPRAPQWARKSCQLSLICKAVNAGARLITRSYQTSNISSALAGEGSRWVRQQPPTCMGALGGWLRFRGTVRFLVTM